MAENLFEGLPPPSVNPPPPSSSSIEQREPQLHSKTAASADCDAPIPVLKSALKRPKPVQSNPEAAAPAEKKLRFKTTTDASEKQVIEAMQKIASHIKTPGKFGKASKLALQLIRAGSVKPETIDHFFAILEAAMSSPTSCTDPSVRGEYHALFSVTNDVSECLNKKQKNQLTTWTIMAVVANDLFTDDSFVFSKASGRIKEIISNLPVATEDDDLEEAATLENETKTATEDGQIKSDKSSAVPLEETSKQEFDPFGLDALIPSTAKIGERRKGKKEAGTKIKEEEETKRFLKSQREALITCLEIAARRYKTAWCQTVIDILVKHAFDNVAKFTSRQRDAIGKLWASIREQQMRRKQGKSITGKLDVNAFEWLQQKYAGEKISIRHAVGGSGERRAQQWLG
ncbi:nucleolar/coiled-body phosphoprotein [Parasponia andersonii]|uniref:Nucleolar/coiled-body phosphoprotein n=1 Tax=Parasponia andersonii TaxID=3476 RepID=A0A2P5C303_PARAD|nr:nucleolar/coiled-body phosphoprotein [Parasponia andersonii]